jgi:hypothetical protein
MIAPAVGDAWTLADFYIAVLRFVDGWIIGRVRHVHDYGNVRLERIGYLSRAQQPNFLLHVGHGANFRLQPGL